MSISERQAAARTTRAIEQIDAVLHETQHRRDCAMQIAFLISGGQHGAECTCGRADAFGALDALSRALEQCFAEAGEEVINAA